MYLSAVYTITPGMSFGHSVRVSLFYTWSQLAFTLNCPLQTVRTVSPSVLSSPGLAEGACHRISYEHGSSCLFTEEYNGSVRLQVSSKRLRR